MAGGGRAGRGELLVAGLLALSALPLLLVRARYLRDWGDEGYFVGAALRTLEGQVVYRDFQHNYPPGRALLLAGLFASFGKELAAVRATWAVFHALAVALAFLVARRLAPADATRRLAPADATRRLAPADAKRRLAPAGAALGAALLVFLVPVFPNKAVELCLSGWVLLVLCRVAEGRASDLGAGLALALAGWLRHDVAVFGALLFPLARLAREPAAGEPQALLARFLGAWRFAAGFALGLAPLVVWLGSAGALGLALRELALSGFVANQVLSKPFPSPFTSFDAAGLSAALSERLPFWVPPVTYAAALALALARLARRAPRSAWLPLLLCALYGSLLFAQVLPRSDFGHLDKALVPALILQAALVAAAVAALRRALLEGAARARLAGVAALTLALLLPAEILWARGFAPPRSLPKLLLQRGRQVEVRAPRGSVWFGEANAPAMQAFFDELAPFAGRPGETMVVYPAGATFHLLFDLPSPLRFDVLRPGELAGLEHGELVPNNPRVLAEIEAVLETSPPRILWDTSEPTNPELQRRMLAFARRHGYRPLRAGLFVVFVRS